MVFFDGGSTDGTLEILREFRDHHPDGKRLLLVENKDPADLKDDYVRLFDESMRMLDTDLAFFLHPDMWPENPQEVLRFKASVKAADAIAATTHMRSFAGEPKGELFEIKGRSERWKNIYRLRNPDLGAHYHGHYGAADEDIYFSEITGDAHEFYGPHFARYPYPVIDSGIRVLHFSDVRSISRRIGRMETCLRHQGYSEAEIPSLARTHPRVNFNKGDGFDFVAAEYPKAFLEAREAYADLLPRERLCRA